MKANDLCKESFHLAVKLLGLLFLYDGLKDLSVPALMDLTIIKGDTADDVFNAILSASFNLIVAWWLLGNKSLVRRAYPAASRILNNPPSVAEPPMTPVTTSQPRESDMEAVERKLAELLYKSEKPLHAEQT